MANVSQVSAPKKSAGAVLFVAFILISLVCMLAWFCVILRSAAPDKASWLMVPLTSIYVVLTLCAVAAAAVSANAAAQSARVMGDTLEEMRRSNSAMYSPAISFPHGFKCWFKPSGSVEVRLSNLHDQPAIGLRVLVWQMEENGQGERVCKYSSLTESAEKDSLGNTLDQLIVLEPSKRTDEEKIGFGAEAIEQFKRVFGGKTPNGNLCAVTYMTRLGLTPVLVYDLAGIHPGE